LTGFEHGKFVLAGKRLSIEALGMCPWVTSGSRGFRHAGLDPASRMPYHIDHILDSGFRRKDGTESVVPTIPVA